MKEESFNPTIVKQRANVLQTKIKYEKRAFEKK